MIYYAYLKQQGEGCDYTIGCAQTLKKIKADSDDEARQKLKKLIQENYTGEQELESVLLFNSVIDFDLNSAYDEYNTNQEDEKNKLQHLKDREEFERLKRKLGE